MSDPSDLYAIDDDCTTGQCDAEVMFLPQRNDDTTFDQQFAGTDVDSQCDLNIAGVDDMILSDELFPPIMDGALITKDGLLDSFARHYPERAQLLATLIAKENYQFVFVDNPVAEELRLRESLKTDAGYIRELKLRTRHGIGYSSPIMGSPRADLWKVEARYEANLEKLRAIRYWKIAPGVITTTARINRNIDVTNWTWQDDPVLINNEVTNKQGADWLNEVMGDWMARSGMPGATSDEEFQDNFNSRVTWGTLNVVLGAAEVVAGGAMIVEAGWTGVGALAGGAMTVAGFEAITQGINMLRTPVESAHARGLLGDAAFALCTRFGVFEASSQNTFNRYWAYTMLGLSLGGAGVSAMLPVLKGSVQVVATGSRLSYIGTAMDRGVDSMRLAIVGVKNASVGALRISFAALPSGRIINKIEGIGRFVIPRYDSLTRVFLREVTADAGLLLERSRKLASSEVGIVSFREGAAAVAGRAFRSSVNANRLVLEVSARMGIDPALFSRIVSSVVVGAEGAASSFNPATRVLTVASDVGKSRWLEKTVVYNEFIAMTEIAHEIHHAMRVHRWVSQGRTVESFVARMRQGGQKTLAYYREEVRVETAAREAIEQIVTPRIEALTRAGNAQEAKRLQDLLDEAGAAHRAYLQRQSTQMRNHFDVDW